MSNDLREQAKKMLENANPEDLRRIAEMMRGRADDQPGMSNTPGGTPRGEGVSGGDGQRPRGGAHREWDGPTDLVDARAAGSPRPDEKFSEISRWSADPDSNGAVPAGTSAARVRAAAAGADRAVEQQVVPSRYGPFVKRVFRRYVEQATSEGGQPASPRPSSPDAPDARPR